MPRDARVLRRRNPRDDRGIKMEYNVLSVFILGTFLGALFGRLITFGIMAFTLVILVAIHVSH